jgi:DnaJ-class molecular chaperone
MPTKKLVAVYDQCPDCHGTGKTESRLPSRMKECDRCRGTGFIRRRPGMMKKREEDR